MVSAAVRVCISRKPRGYLLCGRRRGNKPYGGAMVAEGQCDGDDGLVPGWGKAAAGSRHCGSLAWVFFAGMRLRRADVWLFSGGRRVFSCGAWVAGGVAWLIFGRVRLCRPGAWLFAPGGWVFLTGARVFFACPWLFSGDGRRFQSQWAVRSAARMRIRQDVRVVRPREWAVGGGGQERTGPARRPALVHVPGDEFERLASNLRLCPSRFGYGRRPLGITGGRGGG